MSLWLGHTQPKGDGRDTLPYSHLSPNPAADPFPHCSHLSLGGGALGSGMLMDTDWSWGRLLGGWGLGS
jgi:hypothetical protein